MCCEFTYTRTSERSRCPVVRWDTVLNPARWGQFGKAGADNVRRLSATRQLVRGRQVCMLGEREPVYQEGFS